VDVESDIVNSGHTVLLTWFLSQPSTAGLSQHFPSTHREDHPTYSFKQGLCGLLKAVKSLTF